MITTTTHQAPIDTEPTDTERVARYALACLTEPGDPATSRAIAHNGAPHTWAARQATLAHATIGALERAATDAAPGAQPHPHLPRFLIPGDTEWPTRLDHLPAEHSPLGVWVYGTGNLAALTTNTPALIGSRAATHYGQQIAHELSQDLHLAGHQTIASTGYGIDNATHRGALQTHRDHEGNDGAGHGTVAVLPSGINSPYPHAQTALLAQIGEAGGIVLTQQAPGHHPTRSRLQGCQHLIAALASAVVVVEAASRSAALGIATKAATLGRPIGAVPGPINSSCSTGTHRLIQNGATLITTHLDILEILTSHTGTT